MSNSQFSISNVQVGQHPRLSLSTERSLNEQGVDAKQEEKYI